jgi:RHS repeat-associated protein
MIAGSQSYNYVIPILNLPGRAGMDLALNLYYNSRIWDINTVNATATFNADRDFPSYGFRLDFGFVEYDAADDQYIVTDRDGTKHALPNNGGYNSADGTYSNYNPSTNVLTYKNGTTAQFAPFPTTANLFRPTQIKDTNGNYISIAYVSGHEQLIQSVTDTLGRVINFHYDGSNRLSFIDQNVATSPVDPTGVHRYVTFNWSTLYGTGQPWYSFSGLTASGVPALTTALNVLAGCTYANNTGYRFTYGDWAIINKIENLGAPVGTPPTAATRSYVSYNYPLASAGALTDAPAYTQETFSPDGLTTNTSVWNYAITKAGTGVVTSVAVTDPLGNISVTNLDQVTGLLSSIQKKDSSGALLRTVGYVWTTSGGVSVPGTVTSTLNDTGQQSSVQYSNYDAFGNAGDVKEIDYGGQVLRETVTTYSTTRFAQQHILNLPTQILMKNAAGTTVARTDFDYDTTSITSVTDAANHDNTLLVHGNLTSITRYADAAGGGNSFARHFFYDSTGNVRTAELDCCNQEVFNFSVGLQYAYPTSIVRGPVGMQFTTSATYNFDKGLRVSSTDENGQVTQYQYDSMNRPTALTMPPQGATSVQLNTAYDDGAASPLVTNSATPSTVTVPTTVTTLDGLGHVMQVDTKNGSTLISTTKHIYDKLWRRSQVSNPFGPSETAVYTNFSYDALGRSKQVTPPSSGFTQYDYSGNAVTLTDPAGKQRKSIADALGRLVEVDEPGEVFSGSASSGSLTIGGTLRSQAGVGAAPGTGTVSLSGTNQCTPDFLVCDSGLISVAVNGSGGGSVPYPNGDPVGFLAQYLTNSINQGPYVNATWNNDFYFPVITLTAKTTGSGTNYSLSTLVYSNDPTDFTPPSYAATASGPNLTGGSNGATVFDSGTVTVNIGGFTASAPYSTSGNNTAALVVTALVGTGPTGLNRSGSPVHATANGSSISFTYNTVGATGNVNLTASSSPDNSGLFPGGSFSGSSALSGGADAYSSGLAHPYATTYTFNPISNITTISAEAGNVSGQPASGQPRSYTYDGLGRLITATTPESGTVTKYYTNSAGSPCASDPTLTCQIQDARGVVKNVFYDGINRVTGIQYSSDRTNTSPDPANTAPVTYQYDSGGAAAFALGRLTKITEGPATPTPVNSHTFTYDNLGRILTDSQSIDQHTYLIQYAYNLASEITSITYPSGRVVLQNYDTIGRVCAIGASGSTCTAGTRYMNSLTYNAAGETLGLTLGNGAQGAFTYNDHLQLASLRYFKGSTEILNLAYDYTSGISGNDGQIQIEHFYTTPGVEDLTKSEVFTYDPLGRLTAAHTGVVNSTSGAKTWSLQWAYDRFGNRLSQTMLAGDPTFPAGQPTLTFDPATNRISNAGYTYDAAGNMTHDATAVYAYDGASRLTKINTTGAVYSYFGPYRIKKVVGSTTTRYIYSGAEPIAEYVNGATTPSTEYIYAGSRLLATIAGTTTTYHHPDHLSNRAESNSSGTRIRTYGQLPFGEVWYETGTADKWKFTNYERDSATGETGLDYAGSRYYSSTLGRFLSADLMQGRLHVPRSLNRYAYVGNDPINITDPRGEFWFEQTFCVNSGSGDVCETEWEWVDLGEGGGGGGGGSDGGGGDGGGGGGGSDGDGNNQTGPQCILVIGINNNAGLSPDVVNQLEKKISDLFGPSVGVTFVDGAGGQPGEGNFQGHIEGPGPSAPKADYQIELTTSAWNRPGSWGGNYGATTTIAGYAVGTPSIYTDTIQYWWPSHYASVLGVSSAHELVHRITNWDDVAYDSSQPHDIMATNDPKHGSEAAGNYSKDTFALTKDELAALLQKCQEAHK